MIQWVVTMKRSKEAHFSVKQITIIGGTEPERGAGREVKHIFAGIWEFLKCLDVILYVSIWLTLNVSLVIGIGGLHDHNQHQILQGIPGFCYMAAYTVVVIRFIAGFFKHVHSGSEPDHN